MRYRELGKTGLKLSEIGFGAQWLRGHTEEHCRQVLRKAEEEGINLIDCWMAEPEIRTILGNCLEGHRDKWYIQGHIGAVMDNGQYKRSRDIERCRMAFEDLLTRLKTDYIDIGMIHYVDAESDWERVMNGPVIEYIRELKASGVIRHTGISTHNPAIGKLAALSGEFECILFSINPAFDMAPAMESIWNVKFEDYDSNWNGIAPERAEFYDICQEQGVGINVMKGYASGRLFNADDSPFGVALTPVQCIHYAMTRPATCSFAAGFASVDDVMAAVAYETATDEEKEYMSVLNSARSHSFGGKCMYCNHCLPCPENIDVGMVGKLYDLAVMHDEIPNSVLSHYRVMEKNASDCRGCHGCETRCPFGVKVAERMAKAAELFG